MYKLPAGLLDNDIEFFNDPHNPEVCYSLTSGRVQRINENPYINTIIDNDMAHHPEKVEALVQLGYESVEAHREKYCSCCFGAFDLERDVVAGDFKHNEYWPCPKRGSCPVEGKLCNALKVGEGKILSKREIEVLSMAGKCMLDKEIASALGISEETVKIHLKHIREKSGLMNKKDMVLLAHQKNLL